MTKRALAVLFACLAITAVVAGCGGDDDTTGGGESTEASGSAPTKAVFIKEADGICADSNEVINEELAAFSKENDISENEEPSDELQVEAYESILLPNVAEQGEEIAALTPPEGDEQTVEAITDALAEGVEDAEANPEQFLAGKNPLGDASKMAGAYGFKVCGSE